MKQITFLLMFAVLVHAQDPEPPKEEKDTTLDTLPADAVKKPNEELDQANALLSRALRHLKRSDSLVVRAKITHEESKQAVGPMGNLPAHIRKRMGGVFGANLTPYTGNVEAWVTADGAAVLVSEQAIPGFAIYTRGERTITQTTVEKEELSLDNVRQELAPLLDVVRFSRHVLDGKLTPQTDAETGDVTFSGTLPREVVKPLGGGQFNRIRTLKVDGTLVVSKEGRFKSIAVKVTHNDPVAESRKGGGRVIIIQGGGGGKLQPVETEKDKDKHELEGGKTTYTLSFAASEPSDRAKDFRRRIERIADR